MCRHRLTLLLVLTLVLSVVPARSSQAQWQVNGAPVCTTTAVQQYPTIVSDGAGGAIVTWSDGRALNGYNDIYAQRLNAAGVPQWTTNGVALCSAQYNQDSPTIVSDGAGGAIVTWWDNRSGSYAEAYVQRVNAAGEPQWTDHGVALGVVPYGNPAIASDGAGGAIITWGGGVQAQRVNAAGAPQWTPGPVTLCSSGYSVFPTIISDGAGGAIVTWVDYRGPSLQDIYAQRVNAVGEPQWNLDGVALCTAANHQWTPTIASDDSGGAIVTWSDSRNQTTEDTGDIYAQRVSAAGSTQWTADGVPLCTAEQLQANPTIAADGAGGAIVTWQDNRTGGTSLSDYHVYAQRVSAAGSAQWTADGVALSNNVQLLHVTPVIASDGAGGAIVSWVSGPPSGPGSYSIHAQRLDAAGAAQWTVGGVALCTGGVGQFPTIVSDGAGGAIVTWQEYSPYDSDIYAQRVYGSGGVVAVSPPGAPARFQLLAPSPNPTRDGQLTIRFSLPSSERVSAQVLDVEGRRVRTLATDREFSAGAQALGWDGRNNAGVSLPNGVYFVEVRVGTHAEARRAVLLH